MVQTKGRYRNDGRWKIRQIRPIVRLIASLALLAGVGAAPASADELLKILAGEWIGKGTGILRPGAPAERVYCRIENVSVGDGAVLEQSGRCAIGNDTGRLAGQIRSLGGGRYDGTLTSPAMSGAAEVTGTGDARQLDLKAVYEDSKTGRQTRSVITLKLIADGQYRLVTAASDAATGEPVQSSDIAFRRQEP